MTVCFTKLLLSYEEIYKGLLLRQPYSCCPYTCTRLPARERWWRSLSWRPSSIVLFWAKHHIFIWHYGVFLWWLKVFFSLDGWSKRFVTDVVPFTDQRNCQHRKGSEHTLERWPITDHPQAPLIRFLMQLTTLIQRAKKPSFWIVKEAKAYKGQSRVSIVF